MGKGGGGTTQSTGTTYQTNIPEYAEPYVMNMLGATQRQLFDISDSNEITGFKPYKPYSSKAEDYIAGFSPMQEQAMRTAASPQAFGQQVQGYMSPYMQNVVDIQKREAMRGAGIMGAQQQAQATGAGAFGGYREGIQRAENQRNLGMQMNDIQLKGQQMAFDNAQQQARMSQGQQMQYGAMQQAQEQQKINQRIQDFANAQQYPLMQLGTMSNMLRGLPMQAQTTNQYVAAPNPITQGIGVAGAGASIYNAMKPSGAAGGLPSEFKYASGGITSVPRYDVGGEVYSDLMEMNIEQLRNTIRSSSSQRVKEMAKGILAEKAAQRMAGGGIVAFKDGGLNANESEFSIEQRIANLDDYINNPTTFRKFADRIRKESGKTEKDKGYSNFELAGEIFRERRRLGAQVNASGASDEMTAGEAEARLTPPSVPLEPVNLGIAAAPEPQSVAPQVGIAAAQAVEPAAPVSADNSVVYDPDNPNHALPFDPAFGGIGGSAFFYDPNDPSAGYKPGPGSIDMDSYPYLRGMTEFTSIYAPQIAAQAAEAEARRARESQPSAGSRGITAAPTAAPQAAAPQSASIMAAVPPAAVAPPAAAVPPAVVAPPVAAGPSGAATAEGPAGEAAAQAGVPRVEATPTYTGPTADIQKAVYEAQRRADRPESEFLSEVRAGKPENTAAAEYRKQIMAERSNTKQEAERQRYMRAAQLFARWGSTPGPTLAAGLKALEQTIPELITDEKEQKKIMRELDKVQFDIDNATRLEELGDRKEARALKEKAADRAFQLNERLAQSQTSIATANIGADATRYSANQQLKAAEVRERGGAADRASAREARVDQQNETQFRVARDQLERVNANIAREKNSKAYSDAMNDITTAQGLSSAKDADGKFDPSKLPDGMKPKYETAKKLVESRDTEFNGRLRAAEAAVNRAAAKVGVETVADAALSGAPALPAGIPIGSKPIGTDRATGKTVYQTPDGKRLIED